MIKVKKRNGSLEQLDIEKIHKVVTWACEGLNDVSISEVELKANIEFYDGISTQDIHDTLVKSAHDLITEHNTNYQYVAGRLLSFSMRKDAWGGPNPPKLKDFVKAQVENKFYTEELAQLYSDADFDKMETWLDHERDLEMSYIGVKEYRGKYAIRNRALASKSATETPQFTFIMIAATQFMNYPVETRLEYVRRAYKQYSEYWLSQPTPIMGGMRTPLKQFSSCVLIEVEDSLDSINAGNNAIVDYISARAGIGLACGAIRAENDIVRNGEVVHTGMIPFLKLFEAAVKSCSQGGIRGGSATVWLPIWHKDVEDFLVLKNNKGTHDNRVRKVDYGFQFNKMLHRRFLEGKSVSLFSPAAVPGLLDAFYADENEFIRLYEEAERNGVPCNTITANDIYSIYACERGETGRLYYQDVDNVNNQGSFIRDVAPIKMSNLCAEINQHTKPVKLNGDGLIALCTLAAFNMGLFTGNLARDEKKIAETAEIAVRSLDALLTYQDYKHPAAKRHTDLYRPLGVGVINYAYFLAKNRVKYGESRALELTNIYFEMMSFHLLKASVQLAKEFGRVPGFDDLQYSRGLIPQIDLYNRNIDELVNTKLRMDWESLRDDIKTYGVRNATLMALMPSETSSKVSNATNGIEPPRGIVVVKGNKDNHSKQVIPDPRLKNHFTYAWKSPTINMNIIKTASVMQRWVDQGISVNTYYNLAHYPDGVPIEQIFEEILMFSYYGGKQIYYHNVEDQSSEILNEEDDDSCVDGACKI